MMKPIVIKFLVIIVMFYASVLNAATDEFVAHIVDIDIKSAQVTLLAKDIRNIDYHFAYDVRIRLANGQKGAVANLRKGNQVTAVGDSDKKVIYSLRVLN